MKRFVLENYPGDEYRHVLVDTSTAPSTIIAADGGEPEDQSFVRDWAWVPDLLNRLAAALDAVRAERLELLESIDDLRRERDALLQRVDALRAERDELAAKLAAKERK